MIYIRRNKKTGKIVQVVEGSLTDLGIKWDVNVWHTSRNNMSFDMAANLANELSEFTGEKWLPVDEGPNVSPRYDVVKPPKIGDKVSYAFNGDYYPCGEVTKISDSYRRIEVSTGETFYRRKHTSGWRYNQVWGLTPGHISKRNPEF